MRQSSLAIFSLFISHLDELQKSQTVVVRHRDDGLENRELPLATAGINELDNSIIVSHKFGVKNPSKNMSGFVVFMWMQLIELAYKYCTQEMGLIQDSE